MVNTSPSTHHLLSSLYSCNIIIMPRTDNTNKQRQGLAKKALDASAARLAARTAVSDEVVATPLRTSPRRDKRAKSVTQPSVTSSRGKKKTSVNTPSQLVAESQSLLSPEASPTQGAPLLSVIQENVESQITQDTNFPSDKSDSTDEDDNDGVTEVANHMSDDALLNFFDNNDNEGEVDPEEMGDGLEDLNDYSSDQFSLNERRY